MNTYNFFRQYDGNLYIDTTVNEEMHFIQMSLYTIACYSNINKINHEPNSDIGWEVTLIIDNVGKVEINN